MDNANDVPEMGQDINESSLIARLAGYDDLWEAMDLGFIGCFGKPVLKLVIFGRNSIICVVRVHKRREEVMIAFADHDSVLEEGEGMEFILIFVVNEPTSPEICFQITVLEGSVGRPIFGDELSASIRSQQQPNEEVFLYSKSTYPILST